MPEGDTVFVAATRLHRALAGQALTKTDFRVPPIATADLAGRGVLEVASRGKHFLFRIEGGVTFHCHFKMEGEWHLYRHGARPRGAPHTIRAVLETQNWVAIGFNLTMTELVPTDEEDRVVGHLGPDPLTTWDAKEALRRLRLHPDRPIGETLLDQTVIAGPGNVYKCEISFLRGVDPWTPVRDVPDHEGLVALTARLMHANRRNGMQVTTGDDRPGRQRWVYGRGGQPCRRCGTPIRRKAQGPGGERVTYWCPTCQPPRLD
ncbi:MAG TPA: DNA-formamidopyrimidine glycosylase family protein [Actinomycetota bacterium]|nr:DNA-formamidopyrimidine glycosylase family protein [Actinomycetota bacterium]